MSVSIVLALMQVVGGLVSVIAVYWLLRERIVRIEERQAQHTDDINELYRTQEKLAEKQIETTEKLTSAINDLKVAIAGITELLKR